MRINNVGEMIVHIVEIPIDEMNLNCPSFPINVAENSFSIEHMINAYTDTHNPCPLMFEHSEVFVATKIPRSYLREGL